MERTKFLSTFGGGGGGGERAAPGPGPGPVRPPVNRGDRPGVGRLGFIGSLARRAASAVGRGVGIVRSGFREGLSGGMRAR